MDIRNQGNGTFSSRKLLAVLDYGQGTVSKVLKGKIACVLKMKRSHLLKPGKVLLVLAMCMIAFYGNALALMVGTNVDTGVYVGTANDHDWTSFNTAVGASSTAGNADFPTGNAYCTATGYDSNATGVTSTATGASSEASGAGSTATGANSSATGAGSTATGASSQATGLYSTATGFNSQATGEGATTYGAGASAATNDTVIGFNATAAADNAVVIGATANITPAATNSVAVGAQGIVNAEGGTALGQNASVSAPRSVALGQNSVANEDDTVSVGSAGSERRITNVAAGINDTDAVNVSQIQDLQGGFQGDVSILENRIDDLDDRVDKLDKRVDDVGAFSAALASVEPNPNGIGNKQFALGIGHYNGTVAVAGGFFYFVNKNLSVNAKAAFSTAHSESAQSVGVTFSW